MARLELEVGTDVLLLETGDALILEWYNPILVTPSTLALTLTTYIPTIAISGHQTVTPSTLALSLTTYAPSISTRIVVRLELEVGTDVLLLETGDALLLESTSIVIITPSTLALTITEYAPTIQIVIIPTTLALALTAYAPTVSTPRLVTPSTLALVLTTYTPSAILGLVITPSTLALILTSYALTVRVALAPTFGPDLHIRGGGSISGVSAERLPFVAKSLARISQLSPLEMIRRKHGR